MSDVLISSLQKRVDDLTTELATIRAEAKDRRLKGRAFKEENDALKAQVATLTTERDTLDAKAKAKPGELQTEIDSLKGKLRDRDHRDAFARLAKTAGARTDAKAIDDLWHASGYKAEADEINEPQITAAIGSALEGRDWLKAAAPAAEAAKGQPAGSGKQTAQAAAHATREPGPGANRGGGAGSSDPNEALAARYPNAYRIA